MIDFVTYSYAHQDRSLTFNLYYTFVATYKLYIILYYIIEWYIVWGMHASKVYLSPCHSAYIDISVSIVPLIHANQSMLLTFFFQLV